MNKPHNFYQFVDLWLIKGLFKQVNKVFLDECLLCACPKAPADNLCESCELLLPFCSVRCRGCGAPQVSNQIPCVKCLLSPYPFDRVVPLFDYRDPVPSLIKQLKFNNKLAWGRILGHYLAQTIKASYEGLLMPDVIVPVPLSLGRLKERGFNQALELAKPLARLLKIPVEMNAVYRNKETKAQATLSATERLRNCQNAFSSQRRWDNKSIAIIDDVVTTGATVAALAKCLKDHGAVQVDVWCVARS